MTITQQIITVVVVVLGTMTTRFLPFIIFPEGKEPPAVITYLGKVLPCAVIGLLVVFCLKDVPESTNYGLPELIAILFIVALHKWKKSTLLSIGGGTVFYMVLVQTHIWLGGNMRKTENEKLRQDTITVSCFFDCCSNL